jgi:hypothetical protein
VPQAQTLSSFVLISDHINLFLSKKGRNSDAGWNYYMTNLFPRRLHQMWRSETLMVGTDGGGFDNNTITDTWAK